jgi:aryl-alcohol dehydrogenase-like predicted oxidoreductase
MGKARPAELVLGSVQLGLPYGAANRTGMPSHANALTMVRRAAHAGLTLDTARAYGDSENRIGEALSARKRTRTITKLSPLSELSADSSRRVICEAVDASVAASLDALRRDKLDCLLLHRAAHITAFGGAIWERLIEKLEEGTVLSLGVSVQSPQEALMALAWPDVQHLQLPFNLLDWRWRAHGVIDRLAGPQRFPPGHIGCGRRNCLAEGAGRGRGLRPGTPRRGGRTVRPHQRGRPLCRLRAGAELD